RSSLTCDAEILIATTKLLANRVRSGLAFFVVGLGRGLFDHLLLGGLLLAGLLDGLGLVVCRLGGFFVASVGRTVGFCFGGRRFFRAFFRLGAVRRLRAGGFGRFRGLRFGSRRLFRALFRLGAGRCLPVGGFVFSRRGVLLVGCRCRLGCRLLPGGFLRRLLSGRSGLLNRVAIVVELDIFIGVAFTRLRHRRAAFQNGVGGQLGVEADGANGVVVV